MFLLRMVGAVMWLQRLVFCLQDIRLYEEIPQPHYKDATCDYPYLSPLEHLTGGSLPVVLPLAWLSGRQNMQKDFRLRVSGLRFRGLGLKLGNSLKRGNVHFSQKS